MVPGFLLKLFGGKSTQRAAEAVLKGVEILSQSEEMDEKLRAVPAGGTVDLDIPDSIEPVFPTRGGKRFEIDRVILRRRK